MLWKDHDSIPKRFPVGRLATIPETVMDDNDVMPQESWTLLERRFLSSRAPLDAKGGEVHEMWMVFLIQVFFEPLEPDQRT